MRLATGFSGIDGFGLAAQQCGIELTAVSEVEPFCCKVLAHRFPSVPNLSDIRGVRGRDIGAVDIWAGGFPCQDVSVAGKRAGLAGERTGLFSEVVRLADECHPRWLLLENVPGLLTSNGGRDIAYVLRALAECGYGVAWRVLDAQWFGVPQRRRRVFIVGCLGDARRAAEVLFEPGRCARHPAPRREAGTRAAYRLAASVRGTGDGHGNAWNTDYVAIDEQNAAAAATIGALSTGMAHHNRGFSVAATIGAEWGRNRGLGLANETDGLTVSPTLLSSKAGYRSDLSADGHDASEDGTGRGTPLAIAFNWQQSASSERSWITRAGDYTGSLGATKRDAIAWDRTQITSRQNRAHPSREAPPLNTSAGAMVGVRRLMPVECERLQGFPDGWTCLEGHPQQCDCPDSPRYRALGNAVAVPVVEWIFRRLVAVDAVFAEAAA